MKIKLAALIVTLTLTQTVFPAFSKDKYNPQKADGTGFSCTDANNYCAQVGCTKNPGKDITKCVKFECGGRFKKCLATATYFWMKYPRTINLKKK
jgi:hypothetical protein